MVKHFVRNMLSVIKTSTFYQFFLYFVISSLFIIISIGSTLFYYFSNNYKKEMIVSNQHALSILKNSQDLLTETIDRSFANTLMDYYVASFVDFIKDNDMVALQNISSKLSGVVASTEFIDSIYVCNYKEGYVMSTVQGVMKTGEFTDREYLYNLIDRNINKNLVEIRTMPALFGGSSQEVITFTKSLPAAPVDMPDIYVIINVKLSYLKTQINAISQTNKYNLIIANDELSYLYSTYPNGVLTDEVFDEITKNTQNSHGNFQIKINSQDTMVSYLTINRYNWVYYYTMPLNDAIKQFGMLVVYTVAICMFFVLISLIISFFLSRRMYRPIKSIANMFNTNQKNQAEIMSIHDNVSNLITKTKNLEEMLSDYGEHQKKVFLTSLLEGTVTDYDMINSNIQRYGIKIDINEYFCSYCISMDDYAEFSQNYSSKQQDMLFMYITENINEFMQNQDINYFLLSTGLNEITVVVNLTNYSNMEDAKSQYYQLSITLHEIVTKHSKQTYTIGVSIPVKTIKRLSKCYEQSVTSVMYRTILGYNQIFLYENQRFEDGDMLEYPFDIERNILNALKLSDSEKLFLHVDSFIDYFVNNTTYDMSVIRSYFIQLYLSSLKYMNEIDKSYNCNLERGIYDLFSNDETITKISDRLKEFYLGALDVINKKRSNKNEELMQNIKRYIENNIGEDLSTKQLSKAFYISASYLRKLFKDSTGTTIKEYTHELRMSIAKELLKKNKLSINDISVKVGYLSVQAFTTSFKMHTGLTPGEYRATNIYK